MRRYRCRARTWSRPAERQACLPPRGIVRGEREPAVARQLARPDPPAAGASAFQEFQRRLAVGEAARRRSRPRRIAVITLLTLSVAAVVPLFARRLLPPNYFPDWRPVSATAATLVLLTSAVMAARGSSTRETAAWHQGAVAEWATQQLLDPLKVYGFVVLHDRRVPGFRANIDHLVIGPTGVFVVDSKNYSRLDERGGWLWNGRHPLGTRPVLFEARAVANALADARVSRPVVVPAVLAIHRAPLAASGYCIGNPPVYVLPGPTVGHWIADAPTIFTPGDIARMATLADARLRPAVASAAAVRAVR
jgi:hypothetical protein